VLAAAGDERAVPRLLTLCDGPLAGVVLPGLERLADPRAVPTLARLVRTADDNRTRRLAGRALAASAAAAGTRAGLDLYLYASDDRDTLRIAAWVLGQVGDRSAVAPLSRAVTYPDPVVRARAAESLGRLGDAAAVEPLRGALSDVAPSVRANAATALGRLGFPEAAEPLRAALSDEDPNVRSAAAAALRRLG
jgi:HEAT repeat protein